MTLRKCTSLVLAFAAVAGCGTKSKSVETVAVFNCKLASGVSVVKAKEAVKNQITSQGLTALEGDQSSLEQISGRKGVAFHLWVVVMLVGMF
ncbi:MAG: hypothetical protein U5M23_09750 [Marinagarivorans sp.]|nr:hypothetical protein [Marinagarivorans sp.]